MKNFYNICYGNQNEERQYLDLYLPESDSFRVLIYFHGGGMESGDKAEYQYLAEYLTENKVAAVCVNYRMYPNAKYPDFILDAAQAVSWVFHNINNYGNCEGIFLCGSSAGAYLTMMLCFDKHWLAPYHIDPLDINGYIHDAGQPTCHFNVLRERGIDIKRVIVDESAPMYHVGLATEYSPMLFLVSDEDMENRYEQTMLMISTMKSFQYNEQRIEHKILHGTHCHYVHLVKENGVPVLGEIIVNYINGIKLLDH